MALLDLISTNPIPKTPRVSSMESMESMMGSVVPWGVVLFLWSWGIGEAPDNTGVLGRISRRKKDFLLRAWAMFGWCVSNPECVKLMISYESISTPKLIIPLRINVIEIVFKHQVGQIGCFLCLPATHTQNLWPPLTHMFQDRHKVMPQFVSQVGEHNSNNYIWFMVDISILTMVICNMLGIFVVRGFYCFIPGTRFFRTEHVLNALA